VALPTPTIEIDEYGRRIYEPDGETLERFLMDRSHVSVIRGPIGSGTSTACCNKIGLLAAEQRKGLDGIRRSRWAIVRNSYPELQKTTAKTWLDWFPENLYGKMNWARPMTHVLRWDDVELEVFFLALDDMADIKKLRSLELTGIWFNEVEYIPWEIFDEGESRTGRFPAVKDGGSEWDGIIADMNAPNEDHWLPRMARESDYPDDVPIEDRRYWPEDWGYFVQPGALIEVFGSDGKTVVDYIDNPRAENRKWLKEGFYLEKRRGKSKQWIDSRLMNRITFVVDGDPVWPMFKRDIHLSPRKLEFNPSYPLVVSLDFGRRPSALVGQEIGGRLYVLAEFRMYGCSAATFAPLLKKWLTQNFLAAMGSMQFTGDPKGRDKGQSDENSAYDVFEGYGMTITPAPVKNNHIETRIMAVEHALQSSPGGLPEIQICPVKCPTLVAGMSGKYHLVKLDVGEATPWKDKYSDICDCLQYMVLFLGGGRVMADMGASRRAPKRMNVRVEQKSMRRG